MLTVFKVREWTVVEEAGRLRLTAACSCLPTFTTLPRVISTSFPGATAMPIRRGMAFSLTNRGEILIEGTIPPTKDLDELMNLLSTLLTVCDNAEASHCLGLYRTPVEGVEPDQWPRTEVGSLVRRAKYNWNRRAAEDVAARMISVIAGHPGLRRSTAIAAMPTSGSGKHFDAPALWSQMIAKEFGFEELAIERTRKVEEQKELGDEERRRNQEGSMDCREDVQGKSVLVVDDLYMTGRTMAEAIRALRARGAQVVTSLSGAKTARGTAGGVQSLIDDDDQGADAIW